MEEKRREGEGWRRSGARMRELPAVGPHLARAIGEGSERSASGPHMERAMWRKRAQDGEDVTSTQNRPSAQFNFAFTFPL